jgi:hypothetical protein
MHRFSSRPCLSSLLFLAAVACGGSPQTFAPADASTSDDATEDAPPAADGPGDAKHDGTTTDGGGGDAGHADGGGSDAAHSDAAPGDAAGDGAGTVYASTQDIGANIPFLFLGYLGTAPGGVSAAMASLDDAKAAGITHVRFIASGFYPTDMTQAPGWVADPQGYWAAFDAMVAAAGAHGIRLVPSILWNPYLFPDINGEPEGQLFVKGSKSRTMAEKYITQLVTRYASSDGILYWELGNELNLSADIDVSACNACDGGANYCAQLDPPRGTPCQRTAADEFYSCNSCRGAPGATQEDLGQFTADIAALVAGYDSKHAFSSGNSYPRPSAMHLGASPCPACDWTLDTPAEYQTALLALHPAGVAVMSVHHYPGPDLARFGSNDATGGALLSATAQIAATAGKTLYVGEFGQTRPGTVSCGGTISCGGEATWAPTRWVLDDIVTSQVPRAAVWGFDFFQFCAAVPTCNTVISSDPIVAAIGTHNAATGACSVVGDGGTGDAGASASCPIGACVSGVCAPVPGATLGFDSTSDVTALQLWTNCTACTPGTDAFVGFDGGPGGYVHVASNTLPCSGSCTFPGVYALSAKFPLAGPNALLRFDARSSAAGSVVDVIPYDGAGTELAHTTVPINAGGAFTSYALWFAVPAGAATAAVRLELTAPSATLDVDDVAIVNEP